MTFGRLEPSVSEDGRYVAFLSFATDLVEPGFSTNVSQQLYVRDMIAKTNFWISHSPEHAIGDYVSHPVLSRDGTRLVFLSARLLSSPRVQWLHIYNVGSTSLAEIPQPGVNVSDSAPIDEFTCSADGYRIAYALDGQIYLYDAGSETSRLVSADSAGAPGNDASSTPLISDDGETVLFTSIATNLVSTSPGRSWQLYRFDARSGRLALLTPGINASTAADRDIQFPVLCGDGTKAGFMSYASNLATNDDKLANDVFVVSTSGTEPVQLVSPPDESTSSTTGLGGSYLSSRITTDGSLMAFASSADDLVPNDTNKNIDIFLRDLRSGPTRLVSLAPDGHQFTTPSEFISMSTNGHRIAFAVINPSTGTTRSIYVFDLNTGTTALASILPSGEEADAVEGNLTYDGRYLSFNDSASQALCVRDLNQGRTVLVSSVRPSRLLGISPGGKYLVYFGGTPEGIRLIDWHATKTTAIPAGFTGSLQMSADDSAILFYTSERYPGLGIYSLSQNTAQIIATNATHGVISGDGSTVVFSQQQIGDALSNHLFAYDVANATAKEVTFPSPSPVFTLHGDASMTFDGTRIVFSATGNLITGEGESFANIYLYDRIQDELRLVDENPGGSNSLLGSTTPSISENGVVAFQSNGFDLVPNDRNLTTDIFVYIPGAAPRIKGVTRQTDGSYAVFWSLESGRKYQVQFRSRFGSGEWEDVGGPISATSAPFSFNPDQRSGFYRVKSIGM